MKKHLLIIFIASFSILHSQNNSEFMSLSKMNADEKIMYNLLKECTLKKSSKPNNVHFFPLYSIIENDKWLEFKSYIYDEPTYDICEYKAYNSRYLVSIKFFKDNFDYNTGVTDNPNIDKSKREYFIIVTDVPITENRKAMNYKSPNILSRLSSAKPILNDRFNKAYFYKTKSTNEIDKSIYRVQENKNNSYFSNFAIIYNGNNFGVINKKNKLIIPFEYEYLGLTKFGLLARNKKQESFFIDLNNKVISKYYNEIKYDLFCFDYNDARVNNLLLVKKDSLYNILDVNLNEKLVKNYDKLIYYNNSKQILATKDDAQVVIDINTWSETNIKFDKISYINDSLLIVENEKKFGLVKTDGTILLDIKYDDVTYSFDNYPKLSFIVTLNNKNGLANKDGKLVTDIKYENIKYSGNGNFEGKVDNKIEVFDGDGIVLK